LDYLIIITNFFKINWQATIAFSALIVSVATAIITYRTFSLQRLHNRKSLKPFLYIAPYDYENCLKILIKNEGVGPAIIKKITVKNKEYDTKTNIYRWLPSKLPGKMDYSEYFTRSGDFVLKEGKCETMLELRINLEISEEIKEREKIRNILKDLTVAVEYEDIYENRMQDYKRSLKLYAREDNQN